MTDRRHGSTHPVTSDELTQLASDSVIDLGDAQAAASVPGASGHDDPRGPRELVATVFDDPRINEAEHVTVAVQRGDTEALDEIRSRLEDADTRAAGATVIVEGRPSGGSPGLTGEGSESAEGIDGQD